MDNILIDKKFYENVLISNISGKTLIGTKPLCIRFNKVHEFIGVYDGTRYLRSLELGKCSEIFNRIRCFVRAKNGITYAFSRNYARIKVDSYDSLPLEKTLTFHNATIHIKSTLNKDRIHYNYKIFLEKDLYEIPKNNQDK